MRKPNNYAIFKQFDPRWGKKPYPYVSTVASAGCGLCSVTHCVIEQDKYMDADPRKFYKFMKNYAVRGHGTEWIGIDEGLKHFGLKNVKRFSDMDLFFNELDKGNRVGVLLFGTNKAPDGRIFTTVGHYIAFVGYKKKDGRHWLYLKDSGGRNNDGWLCYETSIRGCLKMLWTAEVPKQEIILPKKGYFEYGDKDESIKVIQAFLKKEGIYKGKIGGKYGRLTRKAVRKWQAKHHLTVDGLWGKECTALWYKER